MAKSSILGADSIPEAPAGKDTNALGPSDNSDSGSDAQGAYGDDEMQSDSDAVGTGERATAGRGREKAGADILPDQIRSSPDRPSSFTEDAATGRSSDARESIEGLGADDGSTQNS